MTELRQGFEPFGLRGPCTWVWVVGDEHIHEPALPVVVNGEEAEKG